MSRRIEENPIIQGVLDPHAYALISIGKAPSSIRGPRNPILRPEVRKCAPAAAFRANAAINPPFAKAWSRDFNDPDCCLPCPVASAAQAGDAWVAITDNLLPMPLNDRQVIQAWADHLGIGHGLRWVPHVS